MVILFGDLPKEIFKQSLDAGIVQKNFLPGEKMTRAETAVLLAAALDGAAEIAIFNRDDEFYANGQHTDYSYRLSKNLFNNRVRAVIGGKFSTDADPSQNLKENLIDDISLEYMLTKRDNMYLKVFRHTGYESILEGEITETGVGFVIRKKLSRLGDLFKPMRPKTKKPKK